MAWSEQSPEGGIGDPRRRTAALVLLVGGGCLVLGGLLTWVLGALAHFDGYSWDERSEVVADGRPQAVGVSADRETLLWTWEADLRPDCRVSDRDGELPVRSTDRAYTRPGGTAARWVAHASFEPRHDLVAVDCETRGPAQSRVMVEPRPHLPPAFAVVGGHGTLALGLGGAGLLAVLACPVLMRPGRER